MLVRASLVKTRLNYSKERRVSLSCEAFPSHSPMRAVKPRPRILGDVAALVTFVIGSLPLPKTKD